MSTENIFYKLFLSHPHEGGEGYFPHLLFTLKYGGLIILTGFALVLHGLIPKLHQTTASRQIFHLYNIFKARWDKAHGQLSS